MWDCTAAWWALSARACLLSLPLNACGDYKVQLVACEPLHNMASRYIISAFAPYEVSHSLLAALRNCAWATAWCQGRRLWGLLSLGHCVVDPHRSRVCGLLWLRVQFCGNLRFFLFKRKTQPSNTNAQHRQPTVVKHTKMPPVVASMTPHSIWTQICFELPCGWTFTVQ